MPRESSFDGPVSQTMRVGCGTICQAASSQLTREEGKREAGNAFLSRCLESNPRPRTGLTSGTSLSVHELVDQIACQALGLGH
jgi:hypothetical protein